MKAKNKAKYWFAAKKYGWGWGLPATWQGWVVYAVYFYYIVNEFMRVDRQSHSGSDTLIGVSLQFIIATVLLLVICYVKGEPPKWRWGK